MAERDNPLMYGSPAPKWEQLRAMESVRCGGCGMIHPGRFMVEVDATTGLCLRCSGAYEAVIAEERDTERSVRIVDRWAWSLLSVLAGLLLAAWLVSGCVAAPGGYVGTGGQPSTIEFYDASGRHTGYGKIQGGSVELFNPDSSRRGFGKTGR